MIELDQAQAREFLAKHKIENCEIKKVAGDASFRSYYRIFSGDKQWILMFAPPSHEDVRPFVKIDEFLVTHDFSAPKIFAVDETNGFLLLEDFGDDTYGRVLAREPKDNLNNLELDFYKSACDVLVELHQIKAPSDLPLYNNAVLFREVMLLIDWYLPSQKKEISVAQIARFKHLWFELFDLLDKENQVTVLRDYHADNLMILPSRESFKRVGLLDFQDGLVGSKAYDLVSLLEDARRDVDELNRQKLLQYYLEKSGCNKESFLRDYAILSLQRNIKIVGIFSRLSMRDGKHHYLNMIPRVLNFVKLRLNSNDPIFSEMSELLQKFI
jgi:N-acetylmuramate 1-kinase